MTMWRGQSLVAAKNLPTAGFGRGRRLRRMQTESGESVKSTSCLSLPLMVAGADGAGSWELIIRKTCVDKFGK